MRSRITVLALLLIATAVPVSLRGQTAPTITFNRRFAPPTGTVLVCGKGFSPYSSVVIQFDQVPIGQARTNGHGVFKTSVNIPGRAPEGTHIFTVTDGSGISISPPFLIETDWPQQRFDPGNTANNPYEWKLNTTTVVTLMPAWNTVGRPGPCLGTTAIKSGGVIYFNSNYAGLQALDPATGSLLWGFDRLGPDSENCPPAWGIPYASEVFGGSPTASPGVGHLVSVVSLGAVVAVNTVTHSEAWIRSGLDFLGFFGWPISVGNSLFVATVNKSIDGINSGNLVSLNQFTGAVNWVGTDYVSQPIAYNNGVLYTRDGYLGINGSQFCPSGYNAATGALAWYDTTLQCGFTGGLGAPASGGTALYYGPLVGPSFEEPSALDTTTDNNTLWSLADSQNPSKFALSKGLLYLGWQDEAGFPFFGALNTSDGSIAWGQLLSSAASDPVVADGVVYFGHQVGDCSSGGFNNVIALDAINGSFLWIYAFPGPCSNGALPVPSALVDGTLYVTNSTDGTTSDLWAFR